MNKISIPVNRAYDAIRWASEHFAQFDVQHMMPADKYEFRFESNCKNYTIKMIIYSFNELEYQINEIIDHHLKYVTLYLHIGPSYEISLNRKLFSHKIKEYLNMWGFNNDIFISDLKLQNIYEYKCEKRNKKIEQLLKPFKNEK